MDTLEFRCPACNKTLKMQARFAGRTGRCPNCNTRVQVPEPIDAEQPPSQGELKQAERQEEPIVRGNKRTKRRIFEIRALVNLVALLFVVLQVHFTNGLATSARTPNPFRQQVVMLIGWFCYFLLLRWLFRWLLGVTKKQVRRAMRAFPNPTMQNGSAPRQKG